MCVKDADFLAPLVEVLYLIQKICDKITSAMQSWDQALKYISYFLFP